MKFDLFSIQNKFIGKSNKGSMLSNYLISGLLPSHSRRTLIPKKFLFVFTKWCRLILEIYHFLKDIVRYTIHPLIGQILTLRLFIFMDCLWLKSVWVYLVWPSSPLSNICISLVLFAYFFCVIHQKLRYYCNCAFVYCFNLINI